MERNIFAAARKNDVHSITKILQYWPQATTYRDRHGRLPLFYADDAAAWQLLCKGVFYPEEEDEFTIC